MNISPVEDISDVITNFQSFNLIQLCSLEWKPQMHLTELKHTCFDTFKSSVQSAPRKKNEAEIKKLIVETLVTL